MPPTPPQWPHTKFQFLRIPKEFFRSEIYQQLSPEAILLYGLMMDRCSLSHRNGAQWRNRNDQVYIIYPLTEICQRLRCGHDKATKTLQELKDASLIRLTRPNCSRPYEIIVLPFHTEVLISGTQNAEKPQPVPRDSRIGGCDFSAGNNTDPSELYLSIQQQIGYCTLRDGQNPEHLVRIVALLASVFDDPPNTLRIHGLDTDIHSVQTYYRTLCEEDIRHVLGRLKKDSVFGDFTDTYLFNILWDTAVTPPSHKLY